MHRLLCDKGNRNILVASRRREASTASGPGAGRPPPGGPPPPGPPRGYLAPPAPQPGDKTSY
eukprot:7233854-Prorocentrum_lima.AAC.1